MSEGQDKDGRSQVVERTCAVLRELGRQGLHGTRLIDLTAHTGLSRPTVHRILTTLCAEDFVERTPDRRYRLAPFIHELGLSAPSPMGDPENLRPIVQQLADDCGDIVHLTRRKGDFAQCLLCCEGSYPIRPDVLRPNQALPLVQTDCGRALLGALPDTEARAVLTRASQDPNQQGAADPTRLWEEIEAFRAQGYALSQDASFGGVAGLSMAIPNPNGLAHGALSICAITPRLTPERAQALLPLLERAVTRLSAKIAEHR